VAPAQVAANGRESTLTAKQMTRQRDPKHGSNIASNVTDVASGDFNNRVKHLGLVVSGSL